MLMAVFSMASGLYICVIAVLFLVCSQLSGYEAVSNLTVAVDGVDVTNELWPNTTTANHTMPLNTSQRYPRDASFEEGFYFSRNGGKECLMDLAVLQSQRRFFITVPAGETIHLTCHFCADTETQMLQPMLWYRIFAGTRHTSFNNLKVRELTQSRYDWTYKNRRSISADHTLTIKNTDPEMDTGTYFCQSTDDQATELIDISKIDNIMDESKSFKVLYHVNIIFSDSNKPVGQESTAGNYHNLPKPAPTIFVYSDNIKIKTVWEAWGRCQPCDEPGIKRRQGWCYVDKIDRSKPVLDWHMEELLNFYSNGIPCRSLAVTTVSAAKFRADESELANCVTTCIANRVGASKEEVEFNVNTKVSSDRISSNVVRRTLTRDAGQSVRLVCPNTAIDLPVSWAMDGKYILGHGIDKLLTDAKHDSYDHGRLFVDLVYSLRISPLKKQDESVITCWSDGMKKGEITLNVIGDYDDDDIWTNLAYLLISFVLDFIIFLVILFIKHVNRPVQKNASLMSKRPPSQPSDSEVSSDDGSDADSEVELITIGKDGKAPSSSNSSEAEDSPKKEDKSEGPRKPAVSENFNRRKDIVLESSESLLSLGDNEEVLIPSDESDQSFSKRPSVASALDIEVNEINEINNQLNASEEESKESFHLSSLNSTPAPSSSSTTEVQTPVRKSSVSKAVGERDSDIESFISFSSTPSRIASQTASKRSSLSRSVSQQVTSDNSGSKLAQTVQQWLSSSTSSRSILIFQGESSNTLNSINITAKSPTSSSSLESSPFKQISRLTHIKGYSTDDLINKKTLPAEKYSNKLDRKSPETSSSSETLAQVPKWKTLMNAKKSLALFLERKTTETDEESEQVSGHDQTSIKTSSTEQSGPSSSTSSIETMPSRSAIQPAPHTSNSFRLQDEMRPTDKPESFTKTPSGQYKMSSGSARNIRKPSPPAQTHSKHKEMDADNIPPQTTEKENPINIGQKGEKTSISNPIKLIKGLMKQTSPTDVFSKENNGDKETSKNTQPHDQSGKSGLSEAFKAFRDKHLTLPVSFKSPVKEPEHESPNKQIGETSKPQKSPQPQSNVLSMLSDALKTYKHTPVESSLSTQPPAKDPVEDQSTKPNSNMLSGLTEAFTSFKDKHLTLPISLKKPGKETAKEENETSKKQIEGNSKPTKPPLSGSNALSDVMQTYKDKPIKTSLIPQLPKTESDALEKDAQHLTSTLESPIPTNGYTSESNPKDIKHLTLAPRVEEKSMPLSKDIKGYNQEHMKIQENTPSKATLVREDLQTKQAYGKSSPAEQPLPKQRGILKASQPTEQTKPIKASSKGKQPTSATITAQDADRTLDSTSFHSTSSLPFPDVQHEGSQDTPYQSISSLPYQGGPTEVTENSWHIITSRTKPEAKASSTEAHPTDSDNFEVSVKKSALSRDQDTPFHSTTSLPFNARK